MAKTQFTGNQILNNSIVRADHNIATTGLALITKLIAGTNMTISSTGIDPGTGDVTIHASGSTPVSSVFNRSGAVVKVVGDYNLSDLGGLFALTQLPALTGDFSTVAGAVATTLATVNANVGTFNSLTVNAKGLVTAASLVTNLIATPLNATALTGYSDNSTYYGNATTANGWPLNGTLTGQRFGVYGVQRVQNQAGSAQFNRSWDGTALAWRVWVLTVDCNDYTGKGVILAGTAANAYASLVVGTDGQVLTASSASSSGVAWALLGIAGGGTGSTTAAAAFTNLGAAPINSPVLTGNPTTNSPGAGNVSTKTCSTGFLQHSTNGITNVNVSTASAAGFITLTSTQYLVPVIVVLGTNLATWTTGPTIYVSNTGSWCIINNTSGATVNTLTVSTVPIGGVNGTTTTIAAGCTRSVMADGLNVNPGNMDLSGINIPPIGGTTRQLLTANGSGTLTGTALLESSPQGNLVCIDNKVDPPVSTSGATYYSKVTGGKTLWYQLDTDGNIYSHQASYITNRINYWSHAGGSTSFNPPIVTSLGLVIQLVANVTARNITPDYVGQHKRVYLTSAAVTGSPVDFFHNSLVWNVGSLGAQSTPIGGFYLVIRCIINDVTATTASTFIGLASTAVAFPNATLATIGSTIGFVGIGCDAGDTSYFMCSSDGGTNAKAGATAVGFVKTAIPTGSFIIDQTGKNILEVRLYCPIGSPVVNVYLKHDLVTATPSTNIYQGIISGAPRGNLLLSPRIWRNNGASANSVGVEVISMYLETAY